MSAIVLSIENDTQVYWVMVDHYGEKISSVSCNSLEEITDLVENHKVIVMVDSCHVNQFMTYIPSTHHQKLVQAIPFAIENQLVTKLNDIHFSYFEPRAKEQIVSVIAKSYLNDLLDKLDGFNIRPDKIYPTFTALPYKPYYWTLLLSEKEFILNINPYQGYSFDKENLIFMLEKLFKLHTSPKNLRIFLYTQHDGKPLLELLKKYGINHYVDDRRHAHPISLYASNLVNLPESNLLQTSYVSKHKLNLTKKYLLLSSILVCGSLFTISLRAGLIYKDLVHHNQALRKQIVQYKKELYPKKRIPNSAFKKQVSKESNFLAARKKNSILNGIEIISNIQRNHRVHIDGFDFELNKLKLNLTLQNKNRIDEIIEALSKYNLKATPSQISTEGNTFHTELTIELK